MDETQATDTVDRGTDAAPEPTTASEAPTISLTPEQAALHIEAVLLTSDKPVPGAKLSDMVGGIGAKAVEQAVASLNEVYQSTGRSFRIESVAGGWQILTQPEYADTLARMHRSREQTRLSPAAMETLAIIAYKQPILRADIEAIRGVASGEMIRTLMDRGVVKIAGRAEEIGRPILYGTTKAFLELFGLATLKDLPKAEELRPKA
jgi:segregation and condensation protein B